MEQTIPLLNYNNNSIGILTSNATFSLQSAGNIGPDVNNVYDLGTSSLQWRTLYVNNIIANGITASLSGSTNISTTASYALTSDTSSYSNNSITSSYSISSSHADRSTTSSYSITSSYAIGQSPTSSYSYTSSVSNTSSYANTSSYSTTSSYSVTSSYSTNTPNSITSSYSRTASYFGSGTNNYVPIWNNNTLTNTSSIYQVGNKIGINNVTPTAYLHLPSGSSGAGNSPLKFTSGQLLTTPESGSVEFLTDNFYLTITGDPTITSSYQTQLPPSQSHTYVTASSESSVFAPNSYAYNATDTSVSLIGNNPSWFSEPGTYSDVRFHIDLGSTKIIKQFVVENWPNAALSGANAGVKTFTFWGSNNSSSFLNLDYGTDTGWNSIAVSTGQMDMFYFNPPVTPSTQLQTISTSANTGSYRYYAFKFQDNWGSTGTIGIKRIELQSYEEINNRKGIILNDGNNLSSSRIPFATTNGRLTDDSNLVWDNTNKILTIPVINGSLSGTASWSNDSITSSYALNGGGSGTSLVTGSTYPITSSWSEYSTSASYAPGSPSVSASYALTSSYAANGGSSLSGTDNYFPFWSSNTLKATSSLYQLGNRVAINTTSPDTASAWLDVRGTIESSGGGSAGGIIRLNTTEKDNTAPFYPCKIASTAVYLTPAQNLLDFYVSNGTYTGTEASRQKRVITLCGDGNIGVGTTVPSAVMDISGSNALCVRGGNVASGSTFNQITLGFSGNSTYRHAIKTRHNAGALLGNAIDFYTWYSGVDASTTIGTKHVMSVCGNGYVGIGVTNPLSKLHISDGNIPASSLISTDRSIITYQNEAPGFSIVASSATSTHRAVFKGVRSRGTLASPTVPSSGDDVLSFLGSIYDGSTTQGTAMVGFLVDGTVSSGVAPQRISFLTSTTNAAGRTERLTIKSDGKVGIGTSSPAYLLDLYSATAAINVGINVKAASAGSSAVLFLDSPTSADFKPYISLLDGGTAKARIALECQNGKLLNANRNDLLVYTNTTGSIVFGIRSIEAMRISGSNGYVGIGVTNPENSLDVAGNISCSIITASLFGTASTSTTANWSETASYAITASYAETYNVYNITSSTTTTSSIISSSYAETASYVSSVGSGTNNYFPRWSNNTLTATSSLYQTQSNNSIIVSSGVLNVGTTGKNTVNDSDSGLFFGEGGSLQYRTSGVTQVNLGRGIYYDTTNVNFKYLTSDYGVIIQADQVGDFAIWTAPSGIAGNTPTITNVLRVKNNGYVGIGTTSPLNLLHLRKGTNLNLHLGNQNVQVGATAVSIVAMNDAANANIPLELHGSVFYFHSGNVGIGTTNPGTAKLWVYGQYMFVGTGTNSRIQLSSDWAGSGEAPAGGFISGVGSGNFSILTTSAGTNGYKATICYYNGAAWYSAVEVANVSGGGANRGNLLLMKSGGKVGIGITNPAQKLNVLSENSDDLIANFIAGSPANNTGKIGRIGVGGGATSYYGMAYLVGGHTTDGTVGNSYFAIETRNAGTYTEYFRILNTGLVGIGKTNPVNKLDVVGNISCSVITASLFGNTIGTASWANNSISSSYALTCSYTMVTEVTQSTITMESASYASSSLSSSYAPVEPDYSSSVSIVKQDTLVTAGTYDITSSYAVTASYAITDAPTFSDKTNNYVPIWQTNLLSATSSIFDTGTNVGIGTNDPSYKLTVYTTASGDNGIVQTNGTVSVGTKLLDFSGSVGTISNHDFALMANGCTAINITPGGFIGIGITNPNTQLEITQSFRMPATTKDTEGVIYKGANRFIHDFHWPGTDGYNTWVGVGCGNFTLGAAGGAYGSYNAGFGYSTLASLTSGLGDTAFGWAAMLSVTSGRDNSGFGDYIFPYMIDGSYNTAIGNFCGYYRDSDIAACRIISDTHMTLLGYSATKNNASTLTNGIAIGSNAQVLQSNQVVLGNTNITTTLLRGNVGIGITNPAYKLHIEGATNPVLTSQVHLSAISGVGKLSLLCYQADNSAVCFDSVLYSGAWYAGDTSMAEIYKFSDQLRFYAQAGLTSGTTFTPVAAKMSIDCITGNVGIGSYCYTSNAVLHITGSSTAGLLNISSPLNKNIFTISGSGKIGVGTTNPVNTFDVAGNISCSVVTASLFYGTSSWAENAVSASYTVGLTTTMSFAAAASGSDTVSNNHEVHISNGLIISWDVVAQ